MPKSTSNTHFCVVTKQLANINFRKSFKWFNLSSWENERVAYVKLENYWPRPVHWNPINIRLEFTTPYTITTQLLSLFYLKNVSGIRSFALFLQFISDYNGEDHYFTRIGPGGLINLDKIYKTQAVMDKIASFHQHYHARVRDIDTLREQFRYKRRSLLTSPNRLRLYNMVILLALVYIYNFSFCLGKQ